MIEQLKQLMNEVSDGEKSEREFYCAVRELFASQPTCPDCGERNPADVHTCSPQKPAPSAEPLKHPGGSVTQAEIDVLTARALRDHGGVVVLESALQIAASQPGTGRVAELEKKYSSLIELLGVALGCETTFKERGEEFARGWVATVIPQIRLQAVKSTKERDEALAEVERLCKDAERYQLVKTMTKEQLLFWRGAYGMSDEAIDAALAAKG